ncbi:hypothetical protein TDB9533_03970 [Thalassocella blandensis]|nr:hypothetical protein TDB9533_03970 [Thalassocella blandensis]
MPADSISLTSQTVDREMLIKMIERGDYLIIAGDEGMLDNLPSGNWIAGTIPYFMTAEGGKADRDIAYVTTLSGFSNNFPRFTMYDASTINRVAKEAPEHGFSIIILPAHSDVHMAYAQGAPNFERMFFTPIMGWISGIHLDDLGQKSPKVALGTAGGALDETRAVVVHVPLPEQQQANINIINLFSQGNGPVIRFPQDGFEVGSCTVDGEEINLAAYIKENNIDTKLPLVADYSGISVNVSIQELLYDSVKLYAPVFADLEYRFATPVLDYVSEFNTALQASGKPSIAYSCNCILNYLYSELEGKQTASLTGPMTFGEVAYQLVNQTLVYMSLEEN